MEPKVIEEIAEQLGMAVGEAAKFVEGILPQYAGLQAMENGVLAVFAAVVFAACAAVSLKVVKTCSDWSALIVTVPIGLMALLFAVLSGIDAIGWALFPDAKLLGMAIGAVS